MFRVKSKFCQHNHLFVEIMFGYSVILINRLVNYTPLNKKRRA
jgi:hypothetical protein